MKTDIEIARETKLNKIEDIAEKLGVPRDEVQNYGRYIAKVPIHLIDKKEMDKHNLILVSAITPNKAGVGKTTVSIGLSLGLNKIGKKAVVALREPSLGPCFGMKGGAAGGGYSQVLPMENINLHFTGDFHAVTSAHNMITALLDNYIYQNRNSCEGLKEVKWKRVLDVNDRSLRNIVSGLGGSANGIPTETGFDITAASEIMAILCLATDIDDLKRRVGNILLGYTYDGKPFTVNDMGIAGAITVLLKDALLPNLVQTTENTPAFIHGGPFANIAHGCNSVLATQMALTYGDYVITEAGFGADLGAEKFFNIKCRKAGLSPKLTVIVATAQSLKLHGGVPEAQIKEPNKEGLIRGFANLDKHIENMKNFGQQVIVTFNRFASAAPSLSSNGNHGRRDRPGHRTLQGKGGRLCGEHGLRRRRGRRSGTGPAGCRNHREKPVETPEIHLRRERFGTGKGAKNRRRNLRSLLDRLYDAGGKETQGDRKAGHRPLPRLHRQNPVLLLVRPESVRRSERFRTESPRHHHQQRRGDDRSGHGRNYADAGSSERAAGPPHRHRKRTDRRIELILRGVVFSRRPPIFHGTSSATVRPDLADSTIISIFECFKIVEFLDYFVPGITNRLALP